MIHTSTSLNSLITLLKRVTMSFSVLGTRFGHTEGRVSLAYSPDGEKVVTLGYDGELRTWTGASWTMGTFWDVGCSVRS